MYHHGSCKKSNLLFYERYCGWTQVAQVTFLKIDSRGEPFEKPGNLFFNPRTGVSERDAFVLHLQSLNYCRSNRSLHPCELACGPRSTCSGHYHTRVGCPLLVTWRWSPKTRFHHIISKNGARNGFDKKGASISRTVLSATENRTKFVVIPSPVPDCRPQGRVDRMVCNPNQSDESEPWDGNDIDRREKELTQWMPQ